jgi:hypothetical protein
VLPFIVLVRSMLVSPYVIIAISKTVPDEDEVLVAGFKT